MLTLATLALLVTLILGHEWGHFIAAKLLNIKVDEFGVGFPPKLFSKRWRGTEYSFNLLPFGGFVRIHGEDGVIKGKVDLKRSFSVQPFWKKAIVISAGVLMNFIIGWFAFTAVLMMGVPEGVQIQSIAPASPAAEAGFIAGEVIAGFTSAEEFSTYVNDHKGEPITLNGKTITPRMEVPDNEGPLGISFVFNEKVSSQIIPSIKAGFKLTLDTLWAIFAALGGFLWGIFTGNFDVLEEVSGPVGVFVVVKEATQLGLVYLIQLLGLISLNLAVLNIIPFPALDGGRFLFTALRELFGENVFHKKLELVVNIAGFVFLIALMILVTIKDIISL
ncbi:MAG: Site-2 protease, Metallo peptidase, MEROPS family M50B [Parcubacteria group bacterium GW2011_GWA1_47_11]|uniref:Peptidase M50 domain-containing protein n=1 Tax=Candidatus Colwellbacteria bacterium GWA2_46_10 TaxID=1797684 RepID=A0A1G1YWW2_9BACT|nr:MAG: Site-2 protease, Metallo peptidase, MEROPS family M50B [Parcubacteria group bacterium GW2011_GWA2_46_10]KKU56363.1 MAG: Site-2 protease, Metallo peptidase, MEROPS family M50B [Parcubacteria group bacterium GW2011_GWA1_47_11]OGY56871.1 MAG: hypothetical protein A2119_00625 [Candidatus Colwellbacteria bacterium GWA2_46_10]